MREAKYKLEKRTEDVNLSFHSSRAHLLLYFFLLRRVFLSFSNAQSVHSGLCNFVHVVLFEISSLTPLQSYPSKRPP